MFFFLATIFRLRIAVLISALSFIPCYSSRFLRRASGSRPRGVRTGSSGGGGSNLYFSIFLKPTYCLCAFNSCSSLSIWRRLSLSCMRRNSGSYQDSCFSSNLTAFNFSVTKSLCSLRALSRISIDLRIALVFFFTRDKFLLSGVYLTDH